MHNKNIFFHKNDLPETIQFTGSIAVDTETMGLDPHRDRLCLVQLSAGDGTAHIVQLIPKHLGGNGYNCPHLKALLSDQNLTKIMHYGRFDIAVLQHFLEINVRPVICTKIAARLVRTFTQRHGLASLCHDLLGINLDKQEQTSDWGSPTINEKQLQYAASDVLYLHKLWEKLSELLKREERMDIAQACFDFLPMRARLDLLDYADPDIFSHHV